MLSILNFASANASPRSKRFAESLNSDITGPESAIPQRPVDYPEMRFAVLNLIAGASRSVWITTDFMSDSEIVSSLFMAQFRKLDVQVIVGPAKANDPLSRVSFLTNQRIPTFVRPKSWNIPYESAVMTDEQLVWINGSFDPYSARREFRMVVGTDDEKRSFEQAFVAASGQKIAPQARILPNVGRPATTNYYPQYTKPRYQKEETTTSTGVYNYNRVKQDRNAPQGVATKLPKQTVSQKNQQNRERIETQEVAGSDDPAIEN